MKLHDLFSFRWVTANNVDKDLGLFITQSPVPYPMFLTAMTGAFCTFSECGHRISEHKLGERRDPTGDPHNRVTGGVMICAQDGCSCHGVWEVRKGDPNNILITAHNQEPP